MSYNTTDEILTFGNISLDDFPEGQVEDASNRAANEIDMRVPPRQPIDRYYLLYARRLPIIKEAHAHLTMSLLLERQAYEQITHGVTGDPLGLPGVQQGAVTPEKNTIAEFYLRQAKEYRSTAEALIRQAHYRAPIVRRPRRIRL